MTTQDKLAHLQEAAMMEARAQGNAIVSQHKEALEHVYEQHRIEALRQSDLRVKAEHTTARQQLSMAESKASLELKRELGETQARLKKQLFEEVNENLQEYMKTEEYKKLLIAYIKKAAAYAAGEETTIYINPTDADMKDYLEEYTGMTLTISREDFIGGIRAVVPGRNILIDHAFKGSLESEFENFAFKGGAGIGK